MAALLDAMGNYLGEYESEEERKKREELANTAVHTQEIKTYGDGTQERVTKESIPGAMQPKTVATAAGPVSPDTFARMQQAESGGRDYTATGQPLTSPAGAMFKNQVMPSTAAQPGFGIRPAQSQTPEEYNRVGQEYYQALLKKYNGNEQLAAAAYNMGPGAVDQNLARNQGQFNVAQAPRETQGYLDKVFRGVGNVVNAVIPSAQAGTLTDEQRRAQAMPQTRPAINPETGEAYQQLVQPVAPGQPPAQATAAAQPAPVAPGAFTQPQIQIDDQGNRLITNPDGTTTVLGPDNKPLVAGGMVPQDTPQFRNRLFEEAGKDPFKWMQIAKNPEYAQFPGMQTVANEQARNLLKQQFNLDDAKSKATQLVAGAASGDPKAGRAIADELKNQDGSWVKMILLGFLSPQLAGEEAVKLGFGNKWQAVTNADGKSALVQFNAKGLPLKGITPDNKELPESELASYVTNRALGKGTSLSAEVYVDKQGNRYRSGYDNAGNAGLVNIQGGGLYKGDPKDLTIQSISTSAAKAEAAAQIKANYAEVTAALTGQGKIKGELAKFGYGVTQGPGGKTIVTKDGVPVQADASGQIQLTNKEGQPVTLAELETKQAVAQAGGKAEAEVVGKAKGTTQAQDIKNQYFANESHGLIKPINDAIRESTGSGIGTRVDQLAALFGSSPKGAEAIAKLDVLSYSLLANVPRFEGPQSDRDVEIYSKAAGAFNDSTKPIGVRLAALDAMVTLLKKYDKEGKNDWTFGTGGEVDQNNPLLKKKK